MNVRFTKAISLCLLALAFTVANPNGVARADEFDDTFDDGSKSKSKTPAKPKAPAVKPQAAKPKAVKPQAAKPKASPAKPKASPAKPASANAPNATPPPKPAAATASTPATASGSRVSAVAPTAKTEGASAPSDEISTPDVDPSSKRRAHDENWELRYRLHNTVFGSTGGVHAVDARAGAPGSFRVQLAADFFYSKSFLNAGDRNRRTGGALSLSWAPVDFLELFGAISASANHNGTEQPELFQTLGDSMLGVKLFGQVTPWLALGGDLSAVLLNTVGDLGPVLKGTSGGLRVNATMDFRRTKDAFPLIVRLNAQYFLDNSSQLVKDVEQRRYDALPSASAFADEDRHLISRVERFALGINRVDRLNLSVGFEAPIRAARDFYVSPIAEWHLGVPVNRQQYDCLYVPSAGDPGSPPAGTDGCLERQGFKAYPQTVSLGLRVLPPVRGLALLAAVDLGVTGVRTHVRELAATPPYDVWLALSYAYDGRSKELPPPPPTPPRVVEGHLRGTVVSKTTNTPVTNPIVRFPGRNLSALYGAEDGTFTTYAFPAGRVELEVGHPEFHSGTCSGTVPPEGGDVFVRCELEPLPQVGYLEGRVIDEEGGTPAASVPVTLEGTAQRTLTTNAQGAFESKDLPPGNYTARIVSDDYFVVIQNFQIAVRETTRLDFKVKKRPKQSSVVVSDREIVLKKQINFATDSDEIIASSFPLMNEIVDALMRTPSIRRTEIQGHTDNRGRRVHNLELSQKRAESVRKWLVSAGIEEGRLEAKGYGMTQPLVPNITAKNRARNRRVQFIIRDRDAGESGGR